MRHRMHRRRLSERVDFFKRPLLSGNHTHTRGFYPYMYSESLQLKAIGVVIKVMCLNRVEGVEKVVFFCEHEK